MEERKERRREIHPSSPAPNQVEMGIEMGIEMGVAMGVVLGTALRGKEGAR